MPQSETERPPEGGRLMATRHGEQNIRMLTLALAADVWSDAR